MSEHGDVIETQTIRFAPPKFFSKLGPWPEANSQKLALYFTNAIKRFYSLKASSILHFFLGICFCVTVHFTCKLFELILNFSLSTR